MATHRLQVAGKEFACVMSTARNIQCWQQLVTDDEVIIITSNCNELLFQKCNKTTKQLAFVK